MKYCGLRDMFQDYGYWLCGILTKQECNFLESFLWTRKQDVFLLPESMVWTCFAHVYIYTRCISYGNSFFHPWYLLVLNKISMLINSEQYCSMKAQVMLMKFSLGVCTSFHTYLPFCPHVCIVWRDARLTSNRIWFVMYFNIWKEIHVKMDMFCWCWCGIHEYSVSLKHP